MEVALLSQGPRPSDAAGSTRTAPTPGQVLSESTYREMLESLVSAMLNATPPAARTSQAQPQGRQPQRGGQGRFGFPGGPGDQNNSQRLVMSLQSLLPHIDKYLPGRATAVRQKLTEAGFDQNMRGFNAGANQDRGSLQQGQQGTVDSILQAAAQATPEAQGRLYAQAAMRALSDGNPEQATQIANERLTPQMRGPVLQMIERQKIVLNGAQRKIEETRALLGNLGSDRERITALIQMAETARQQGNKKLATELLEEARTYIPRRAENYEQLEAPLRIAQAYSTMDMARSFEILDPGIAQINELLPAAALLSGFEVRVFKDGEMPFQGGSQLGRIIGRYADEMAALARVDFEGAQAAADRFQHTEPRIVARLSIVRGVLPGTIPIAQTPAGRRNQFR